MCSPRQVARRPETVPPDSRPEHGCQLGFRSTAEVPALLDVVIAAMEPFAYPKKDLFAVRLALEEALVNAVKHGHRGDPTKEAKLRYHVGPESVLLEVEDQGKGFDPAVVPDPLAPQNLERPCGRGLFLIRKYMTQVQYNDRGNRVTMCKHRTDS